MPLSERRVYMHDAACREELASGGDLGKPVLLEWQCDYEGEFIVSLSTSPEFPEGNCVIYTTTETHLEVYNLMIATTYYWKVQCGGSSSAIGSFVTADLAPRILRIPNLWNCRDLGGRVGLGGRRVKQNIVLRTGGFAENSEPVLCSLEELQKKPKFNERVEKIKSSTVVLKNCPRTEIPYLLDGEWTVFLPKMASFGETEFEQVDALTEIPESFLGAQGVKMSVNEKYGIVMQEVHDKLPAVLMMDFVSPAEGCMPFTCGADWYWYLNCNGVTIYDRRKGNGRRSDKDGFMLFLPVKKGHNLLTVYLGSGNASFSWYIAPVPQGTTLQEAVDSGMAENECILTSFCKQGKKDEAGNQLYTKGKWILNEAGREYLRNTFKIKTEIDLRNQKECVGLTESPAGSDVRWINIPSNAYEGILGKPGRENFAKTFRIFLDETNYPIVFHCIGGQDRTGTVAFILNALMGCDENELFLDWECSAFRNTADEFCLESYFDKMIEAFQNLPGDTLCQKMEYYIISLGFTREDIQKLRRILLE